MADLSYLVFNGEKLDIADETARKGVEKAYDTAKSKVQAWHFNTMEELKDWLSDPANIGVASIRDHLYTLDKDEPDWWIETVRGTPNPEGFYYDIKKIGADAMVIMHEYVPVKERIKGSMYLQLGKTRRLIIRVFKKFFNREPDSSDDKETLLFKETTEMTSNVESDLNYRFTCQNMNILNDGESVERKEQKFYFIK